MNRYLSLLFTISLIILLSFSTSQAAPQIYMAGYWDTSLSAAQSGQLKIFAYCPDKPDEIGLAYHGQKLGIFLNDDGLNGDSVMNDRFYTATLNIPSTGEGRHLLELFTKNGLQNNCSWPFLQVDAYWTPTPTHSPVPSNTPTPTLTPTPSPTRSECHPLSLNHCMLPFPSSHYLRLDPSTTSGYRVDLPDTVLPGGNLPTRINIYDGFSPANAIIAEFNGELDTSVIPAFYDLNTSLELDGHFMVYNADPLSPEYGHRHALHVESFANSDNFCITLRPAEILEPNTLYYVGLRNLTDPEGDRVETSDTFIALRDNVYNRQVEHLRPEYEEIFQFFEDRGVGREELDLAWNFHTASANSLTRMMLHMVEEGVDSFDPASADWEILETDTSRGHKYVCQCTGPNFIKPDKMFELDYRNLPRMTTDAPFRFVIYVPDSVLNSPDRPVPVLLFGHGMAASADQVKTSYLDRLECVGVAVDWQGFTALDMIDLGIIAIRGPITWLPQITDRLMQSIVNGVMISKLLPEIATQLESDFGAPVIDVDKHYYLGISLGGIMGGTMMAVHPDFPCGVLVVPGGALSHLIQQTEAYYTDFNGLSIKAAVDLVYPDQVEQQIMLSLIQNVFDAVDPISFARHWSQEPLANHPPRHILMQEGQDDPIVPNLTTEMLLRASGLPLLKPAVWHLVRVPYAETPTNGAHFGGLFQFAEGGHNAGGRGPARDQAKAFLRSFYDNTYKPTGNIPPAQ